MFKKKIISLSLLFIFTSVLIYGNVPPNNKTTNRNPPILPYIFMSDKNHDREEGEDIEEHHHLSLGDILATLLAIDFQSSDFKKNNVLKSSNPTSVNLIFKTTAEENIYPECKVIRVPDLFELGKNRFLTSSISRRGPPVCLS